MGGSVAAGSAFSILQSMGMLGSLAIPAAGVTVVAGAAVAGAAGGEVDRWAKGDYGEPVKDWWNGKHGPVVSQWWNGTETPVLN